MIDGKDVDRAWSPDGTRILARTGEIDMVSIDPVTGGYEETGLVATVFPDWQRRADRASARNVEKDEPRVGRDPGFREGGVLVAGKGFEPLTFGL